MSYFDEMIERIDSLDEESTDETIARAITSGAWEGLDKNGEAAQCKAIGAPLIAKGEDETTLATVMEQSAIGVRLGFGRFGINKNVDSERASIDGATITEDGGNGTISKEMVKVTKKILACQEYSDITTADGRFKSLVLTRALATPYRKGVYVLPAVLVDWYESELREFVARRQELVDAFIEVYEARVQESRDRLADLFDENDYPTADAVRRAFTIYTGYETVVVPSQLANINPTLYQRERERVAREGRQQALELRAALREGLLGLVTQLRDLVDVGPTGRKRRLHEATLDGINEWLALFESRDITNDKALGEAVKLVRRTMAGIGIKDLRKDDAIRDDVRRELDEAAKVIGSMVREAPKRKFNFDL